MQLAIAAYKAVKVSALFDSSSVDTGVSHGFRADIRLSHGNCADNNYTLIIF